MIDLGHQYKHFFSFFVPQNTLGDNNIRDIVVYVRLPGSLRQVHHSLSKYIVNGYQKYNNAVNV